MRRGDCQGRNARETQALDRFVVLLQGFLKHLASAQEIWHEEVENSAMKHFGAVFVPVSRRGTCVDGNA